MKKSAFLILSLGLVASFILFGCGKSNITGGDGESIVIKIAHESPATHPKGVWADRFKEVVEKESKGKIRVMVYHQGSLYTDEREAISALKQGTIQMAIPSTGYLSTVEPSFGVFDLPMLFEDQDTLYKVLDSDMGKQLLKQVEDKQFVGLGYIVNDALDLFSKSPITKQSDLSGKKIRVHSAIMEKTIKALGGNPITMPAGEVYVALQNGTIDGVATTIGYAAPNKLGEVAPFMTNVKISSTVYPVIVSKSFWDKLDPELRNVIKQGVAEATKHNRENLQKASEDHLKSLEENGVKVYQLSSEERKKWKSQLESVYSSFPEQDLIQQLSNR